jgi:hypothetical protein
MTSLFTDLFVKINHCLKTKFLLFRECNLNPLLKEAFELSKSLDSQGVSNNHEAYTNKNNT